MEAHRHSLRLLAVTAFCTIGLVGCANISTQPKEDAPLVEGPPVSDVITPFDEALSCLRGKVRPNITFSVGAILDQTGKEQYTEGGAGKFVTQGAGDIVQSALFQSGVTVLNRRDPRVMETEAKWGINSTKGIVPSNFFITGSITSLDFIPGGGFDVQIAGVGPRYKQHRILVGLDLSMTETKTGRVVANIPLQKQIFASELGFNMGRFFGDTLVSMDFGDMQREPVHFALRQMLNLASFELLTQLMHPKTYAECNDMIANVKGLSSNSASSRAVVKYRKQSAAGAAGASIDKPSHQSAPTAEAPAALDAKSAQIPNAVNLTNQALDGTVDVEGTAAPAEALGSTLSPEATRAIKAE